MHDGPGAVKEGYGGLDRGTKARKMDSVRLALVDVDKQVYM